MKVTKSYIKKLIKEELSKVLHEEYQPPKEEDYDFRITNGMGKVPGLKSGAKGVSIMVSKKPGRGPTPEHRQIFVLPKAIGVYKDMDSAMMSSFTGEAYYMTPQEIEEFTTADSVRPGQFADNEVKTGGRLSYSYSEE